MTSLILQIHYHELPLSRRAVSHTLNLTSLI